MPAWGGGGLGPPGEPGTQALRGGKTAWESAGRKDAPGLGCPHKDLSDLEPIPGLGAQVSVGERRPPQARPRAPPDPGVNKRANPVEERTSSPALGSGAASARCPHARWPRCKWHGLRGQHVPAAPQAAGPTRPPRPARRSCVKYTGCPCSAAQAPPVPVGAALGGAPVPRPPQPVRPHSPSVPPICCPARPGPAPRRPLPPAPRHLLQLRAGAAPRCSAASRRAARGSGLGACRGGLGRPGPARGGGWAAGLGAGAGVPGGTWLRGGDARCSALRPLPVCPGPTRGGG